MGNTGVGELLYGIHKVSPAVGKQSCWAWAWPDTSFADAGSAYYHFVPGGALGMLKMVLSMGHTCRGQDLSVYRTPKTP